MLDVLNSKPRTLTYSQALARNDAENRCYEISFAADGDYSKSVTKWVISFASYFGKLFGLIHYTCKLASVILNCSDAEMLNF